MTKKSFADNLWFMINALVIAVIVMAMLHTLRPYVMGPDPLKPQIDAFVNEIKPVNASELPALLRSPDGKPTMLVIYASWCGPCRLHMPDIVSMIRDGSVSHLHLVFLSRDVKVTDMSTYLVHHGYHKLFIPYLLKQEGEAGLQAALASTGSHYAGHIPYTAFFDAEGRAIGEILGMDKENLLREAEKLKNL